MLAILGECDDGGCCPCTFRVLDDMGSLALYDGDTKIGRSKRAYMSVNIAGKGDDTYAYARLLSSCFLQWKTLVQRLQPTVSSAPECTVRRRCHGGGDAAHEGAREVGQSVHFGLGLVAVIGVDVDADVCGTCAGADLYMRECRQEGVCTAVVVSVTDVTPDPDADTEDALVRRTSQIWRTRTRRRRLRSTPCVPYCRAALYVWR